MLLDPDRAWTFLILFLLPPSVAVAKSVPGRFPFHWAPQVLEDRGQSGQCILFKGQRLGFVVHRCTLCRCAGWMWNIGPWKATVLYKQVVFHFHVSESKCKKKKLGTLAASQYIHVNHTLDSRAKTAAGN